MTGQGGSKEMARKVLNKELNYHLMQQRHKVWSVRSIGARSGPRRAPKVERNGRRKQIRDRPNQPRRQDPRPTSGDHRASCPALEAD